MYRVGIIFPSIHVTYTYMYIFSNTPNSLAIIEPSGWLTLSFYHLDVYKYNVLKEIVNNFSLHISINPKHFMQNLGTVCVHTCKLHA